MHKQTHVILEEIINDEGIDKLQIYETTNWQKIREITKCEYANPKKYECKNQCRGYNTECEQYKPMKTKGGQ